MEGLSQALFTDIQDIKQEKKHHIGVILVSVSPIHAFGSKKQKKEVSICLHLRKKENKLNLRQKIPHRRYMYTYFTI